MSIVFRAAAAAAGLTRRRENAPGKPQEDLSVVDSLFSSPGDLQIKTPTNELHSPRSN